MRDLGRAAAKGAETIIYLASSPEVAETTGQYFYKCLPIALSSFALDDQLASFALDDQLASMLWQRSTALAKLRMAGD